MSVEQRLNPVDLFFLPTLNFLITAGLLWLFLGACATREAAEKNAATTSVSASRTLIPA